jgi:hypothetical protein
MTKKKSKDRERKEQELKELLAELYTHPAGVNAMALSQLHSEADAAALTKHIKKRNIQVADGDLSTAESMLIDQAHVLQSIFVTMTMSMQGAEYIKQMEAYGRMALRAQNQCNRTLKTLLEYKNPKRATFIKQQNNLQINESEKPEKEINPANELLEVNHDSRMDTGTPQETIGSNQEVEAMGKIDRTAD